jgi:hypothetical protein
MMVSPSPRKLNSKTTSRTPAWHLIRQAASKTNDAAGDGTTTATVLAHAIVKEGSAERRGWCQCHLAQARHRQGYLRSWWTKLQRTRSNQ